MKKIIFYASLCTLLAIGCSKPTKEENPPATKKSKTTFQSQTLNDTTTVKVVLSIPDWALGVILSDSSNSNNCQHLVDSLRQLRVFHVFLDTTMLTTHPIGKYVLTRKINPCCPCDESGTRCCACSQTTVFASPSTMRATVRIGKNGPDAVKDSSEGLDFFTIPANSQADTLVIDGKGMPTTKFVMDGV